MKEVSDLESIMTTGMQQGLIYGFMALGILLTFRILGFPDLTVEGTFPLGAAITAKAVVEGVDPITAVILGGLAGGLAGAVTGLMHTKLNVNNILAGILTTSMIYTVMLRTMGRPNIPLLAHTNFFDRVFMMAGLSSANFSFLQYQVGTIFILLVMVAAVRAGMGWFLGTDLGLTIRSTGNNERMIRSLGVNTDYTKLLTLMISNFLVAFSGALACQSQGFADVGMGIGVLVAAIASVMVGEMFFGRKGLNRLLTGVIVGSVIYRTLLAIGIRLNLPAEDFKMVTALLVLAALALPNLKIKSKKTSVLGKSRLSSIRGDKND